MSIVVTTEAERAMALHKHKVRHVGSEVDTSAPSTMFLTHVKRNLKQERFKEEKILEIERDNDLLVARMRRIMGSNNTKYPTPYSYAQGVIHPKPSSLNYRNRKARELQIQAENKAIIKRLCASKSIYSKEDLRPCHFRPHFALPRLQLNSVKKEESILTDRRPPPAGGDPLLTKSSVTARSSSPRRLLPKRKPLPRPPRMVLPVGGVKTEPKKKPTALNPQPSKAPTKNQKEVVLLREALKYRGKYVVASVKHLARQPRQWTIEFYIPEDAITCSASISLESVAAWLGVETGGLIGSKNRRHVHLHTLLRCYDLRSSPEGFELVLVHKAADVVTDMKELAVKAALGRFSENVAVQSIRAGTVASMSKLEQGPTLETKTKTLQRGLAGLAETAEGSLDAVFARYERTGSIPLPALHRMLRKFVPDLKETDIQLIFATSFPKRRSQEFEDLLHRDRIPVCDLVALYSASGFAAKKKQQSQRRRPEQRSSRPLALSPKKSDTSRPTAEKDTPHPEELSIVCSEMTDGGTVVTEAPPVRPKRSGAVTSPRFGATNQNKRGGAATARGRTLRSPRDEMSPIVSPYRVPASKLVAPRPPPQLKSPRSSQMTASYASSPRKLDRGIAEKLRTIIRTTWPEATDPTELGYLLDVRGDGHMSRTDFRKIIRGVCKADSSVASDAEIEAVLRYFDTAKTGRVKVADLADFVNTRESQDNLTVVSAITEATALPHEPRTVLAEARPPPVAGPAPAPDDPGNWPLKLRRTIEFALPGEGPKLALVNVRCRPHDRLQIHVTAVRPNLTSSLSPRRRRRTSLPGNSMSPSSWSS